MADPPWPEASQTVVSLAEAIEDLFEGQPMAVCMMVLAEVTGMALSDLHLALREDAMLTFTKRALDVAAEIDTAP